MQKRIFSFLIGAFLLGSVSLPAVADWNHGRYDGWWRAHHAWAVDVQAHPEYLHDHAWLGRHHDVQVWLNSNPGFVTGYAANPYPIIVDHHDAHAHWHRYADHHWGW